MMIEYGGERGKGWFENESTIRIDSLDLKKGPAAVRSSDRGRFWNGGRAVYFSWVSLVLLKTPWGEM